MSYSPRMALVDAAVSFALTTLARVDDTGSLGIGHVASSAQIAGAEAGVRGWSSCGSRRRSRQRTE